MSFRIIITDRADRQLESLTARDRNTVRTAVTERLRHQPTTASRAIKQLRPNPVADYELRVGDLRVLYDINGADVVVKIVGRKVGNESVVEGKVFDDLRDRPPESPGGKPAGDA